MIKENKNIETAADFEEYAVGMLEAFLETFSIENKLLRAIEEDDVVEDNWTYMYTDRGTKLVKRMVSRLTKLGMKYFPNEDIDLTTPYYQEI